MADKKQSLCFGFLIIAVVVSSILLLALKAVHDPNIPFLTTDPRAEWIRYPLEPNTTIRKGNLINLTAVFRREYHVTGRLPQVLLYVRAFQRCRIWVNGRELIIYPPQRSNWKKVQVIDISKIIVTGRNRIQAAVENQSGPPALWLCTEGIDQEWTTDKSWLVSILNQPFVQAAIADDRLVHPIALKGGSATEYLIRKLPVLILFMILSIGIFRLFFFLQRLYQPKDFSLSKNPLLNPRSVLALSIAIWILLFLNNLYKVPLNLGFDVNGHIEYVNYILENLSIPRADHGWEMYQPPFFYLSSAGIFRLASYILPPETANYSIRLIPFVSGIGQICLAYAASRMLFPKNSVRQMITIAISAILPMNIYMSHYISNESLSALLMGFSLILTIRILMQNSVTFLTFIFLGVSLGLSLLTKFTSFLFVPVILLVLLYQLACDTKHSPGEILKVLGGMLFVIFLLSGWFYMRNWVLFGNLLAGNWDTSITGYGWWQDPGFHTKQYFLSFGSVFKYPYFSGFYSFFDAIYSTLWGDGYYGGRPGFEERAPWNYEYMSTVYFLAVPASLAFLLGVWRMAWDMIKNLNRSWFLLLGSVFVVGFAMIYMALKIPYYSLVKAFNGLALVVPFSIMCAWGIDAVDGWLREKGFIFWRSLLYGWFGTFILAILSSFLVR